MKCKYCRQKIRWSDWFIWNRKCFSCYWELKSQRSKVRMERSDKEEKISEKYWKTQEGKKK